MKGKNKLIMWLGELQLDLMDNVCYKPTETETYKKTKKRLEERRDKMLKNRACKEYEVAEILNYIQKMNIRGKNMQLNTDRIGDKKKKIYIKKLKQITGRLVLAWPKAKDRKETACIWWVCMIEVYVAWKYATKK